MAACQLLSGPPTGTCAPGFAANVDTLGPYKTMDAVYNTLSGGYYAYSWASAPLNSPVIADYTGGTCQGNQGNQYTWRSPVDAVWTGMSASSVSILCSPPPDGLSPSGFGVCDPFGPQLNPHFCYDTQNCVFVAYEEQCSSVWSTEVVSGDVPVDCPNVSFERISCLQTLWPPQDDVATREDRWNCCLGLNWASITEDALKYCSPTWNPVDPLGECEDAFTSYCREHSYSIVDPNGTNGATIWVHGFLQSNSVCGNWYGAALANQIVVPNSSANSEFVPLPKTRWPSIDLEVAAYCDLYGATDTVSCACVNYGFGPNQLCQNPTGPPTTGSGSSTPGCQAYASDTSHGGALTAVNFVTSGNPPAGGFPVGVTDYVCAAPQCNILDSQDLQRPSLLPFDAWFPQFRGTCPSMCLQFITGQTIDVGSINSGGYVYVGDMMTSCTNANGSTPSASPRVQMDSTQTSVVFVNQNTADCGLGICESQVLLSFVNPTPNPFAYTVTCADMPSWLQFENPGDAIGTATSDVTKQINLLIPVTGNVPIGIHDVHCTVRDSTGDFPGAKASTVLRIQAIPMQPSQGPQPLLPNPGAGVPIVWKDQSPSWLPFILVSMALILLLVALHWHVGRKAKKNVLDAQRDVEVLQNPRSTPSMRQFAINDLKK